MPDASLTADVVAGEPRSPRPSMPDFGVLAGDPRFARLRRRMTNAWMLRLFMLARLPLALFAGLRVRELEPGRCAVSVPYGWRSQNPFRSTYFAAQAMAAELSTGALAMAAAELAPASVAMLIVRMESTYGKKATRTATFVCEDGAAIFEAVGRAVSTGEPQTVEAATVGRMADGTEVARFVFTWSFKKRGE